jgi:P-type E1-E2 ATPase
LFCEALDDFILKILILSACVSIGLEVGLAKPEDRGTAWIEGFAILVAVAVCASVAAGNNYQKEKQFLELNSVADEKKRVTVWRNGMPTEIHQDLVLVGDIVAINEGMEIPADGILIESNDITIDESSMTGETNPIIKNILSVCVKKHSSIVSEGGDAEKHAKTSPVVMGGTRALTG